MQSVRAFSGRMRTMRIRLDLAGRCNYPVVVPVFIAFLVLAALIAKGCNADGLPSDQGRTLAFSLGTRNSFVVLPLALSLPSGSEVSAVVIVVQSLVALFGM